ncbi:MAG TPA: glycosyltransferase family 39 protein [Sphingomonas sp.]|nr:glycosyltransferase family 39 protein [Sphingomonas sp.]
MAASPGRARPPWLLFWFLWAGLALLALTASVNHDESQYLAAALLTRRARPFVEFLYLQTPLQPYVFAPLTALAPGWSFVLLRLVTATLGAALLGVTYAVARRAGAERRAAVIAVLLMASCQAFLFAATVVRNDALPALLAAIAMLLAIEALPRRASARWLAVGALLGLATSAKLSYAVVAGAFGLFLLVSPAARAEGKIDRRAIIAFAVGGLAGLLPCLLAWLSAPESFLYGVFQYGAEAPFRWYAANGYAWRLGLGGKAVDTLMILALGPSLIALAAVARDGFRTGAAGPAAVLLDWLIAGGLIAALLPTPTWRQYFLPLEAPLFARFALIGIGSRWWMAMLLGLSATAGVASNGIMLVRAAVTKRLPPLAAEREAHWIGARLRALHARGPVATLSPQVTLDSGYPLDPLFATGPFAYRTADALPPARQRRLAIVGPRGLAAVFDAHPPAAIVTGYEDHAHLDRIGLDSALEEYARRHGYREERSPYGRARLFYALPAGGARRSIRFPNIRGKAALPAGLGRKPPP